MKRGMLALATLFGILTLVFKPVYAQDQKPAAQTPAAQTPAPEQKSAEPEEKPLGPGWLSLDCCVGLVDNWIAMQKSAVEKMIGINISGYIDTGYTWATTHPQNPASISGRYFDKDYNSIQFNDFNITLDKPEKDWGVGFHISADFGRTGALLGDATAWGLVFTTTNGVATANVRLEPSAQLRESYITTTIPVGEGIGVKGGLFVSPLGTEIIPIPGTYNDNISRSFLFNLAVPLRHLGTLFSYPVWKNKDTTIVNATAGIVTGWDDPRDNNTSPSFLGGLAVTPNDVIQFASNIIAGDEPTFVGSGTHPKHNTPRFSWSNVWTFKPMDPLGLSFEYTLGRQSHGAIVTGNSSALWQGVSGIASWTWTDRVITAFRVEWFNDRNGARTGGGFNGQANVSLGEVTFTGSYKFTKMLMGRAEVRQDFANAPVYRVGDLVKGNAAFNQTTLALQLLYTY